MELQTETKQPQPTIVLYRLQNDQLIVGTAIGYADPATSRCAGVILQDPAEISILPDKSGGVSISFRPVMPFTKQEQFLIDDRAVLFEAIPMDNLVEQYQSFLAQYKTGLVVPARGQIQL